VGESSFKIIYKNGYVNGSIFEDGLVNMLKSDILAETWGRPIQATWCGTRYQVGNVEIVKYDSHFTWKRTADHSKWAVGISDGVDYNCFGDMNRMSSQWKRGGMFYCVKNADLSSSLKKMITTKSLCL
jgi:deoxyribonuclease-2